MPNPFNLNPVKVLNFYAYPQGHKHYGKVKMFLNYCDFKEGEEIQIEIKDAIIQGIVDKVFEGNIIVMKIKKLIHLEAPEGWGMIN